MFSIIIWMKRRRMIAWDASIKILRHGMNSYPCWQVWHLLMVIIRKTNNSIRIMDTLNNGAQNLESGSSNWIKITNSSVTKKQKSNRRLSMNKKDRALCMMVVWWGTQRLALFISAFIENKAHIFRKKAGVIITNG